MTLVTILVSALLGVVPCGPAFVNQLQPRDSVLVADQIEYGVTIDTLRRGSALGFVDFAEVCNDTLTLVRGWQLDTLSVDGIRYPGRRSRKALQDWHTMSLRAAVVLAPFEAGRYQLPDIPVAVRSAGVIDTLIFTGTELEVKTMPVDTATFVIHDIKGQIRYPLTGSEITFIVGGVLLSAGLVFFAVLFVRAVRRRRKQAAANAEPPHIVALRELDRYRSDKLWQPEKQKQFYSGITDILKNYIDSRFGIDAPEMTTAELFDALKPNQNITPELYADAKDLFERADFVKFAKYTAPDSDNAKALPVAVRFVTDTYRAEIEQEEEAQK